MIFLMQKQIRISDYRETNWKICIFSHKHSEYLQNILSKILIQIHSFFDSRNLEFVKIRVRQDKTFYENERIFEVSCSLVFLKC